MTGICYEFDSPSTGPLRLDQEEWDRLIDYIKARQEAEKVRDYEHR